MGNLVPPTSITSCQRFVGSSGIPKQEFGCVEFFLRPPPQIFTVPAVPFSELSDKESGEKSDETRLRCQEARTLQNNRFESISGMFTNAQMESNELQDFCKLDKSSSQLSKIAMEKLGLSARAYDRILKVSRTIADLSSEANIKSEYVSEAIQYRSLDWQLWLS